MVFFIYLCQVKQLKLMSKFLSNAYQGPIILFILNRIFQIFQKGSYDKNDRLIFQMK